MAGKIVVQFETLEQKSASVKYGEVSEDTRYQRDDAELAAADGVQAIGSLYIQKSALKLAFGDLPKFVTVTIEAR